MPLHRQLKPNLLSHHRQLPKELGPHQLCQLQHNLLRLQDPEQANKKAQTDRLV